VLFVYAEQPAPTSGQETSIARVGKKTKTRNSGMKGKRFAVQKVPGACPPNGLASRRIVLSKSGILCRAVWDRSARFLPAGGKCGGYGKTNKVGMGVCMSTAN
jgi:hypothetical protein